MRQAERVTVPVNSSRLESIANTQGFEAAAGSEDAPTFQSSVQADPKDDRDH